MAKGRGRRPPGMAFGAQHARRQGSAPCRSDNRRVGLSPHDDEARPHINNRSKIDILFTR